MDVKLDWVSFTFDWNNKDVENDHHAGTLVMDTLLDKIGEEAYFLLMGEGASWTTHKGRKPYSISDRSPGVSVFYNHKLSHALVEISGEGCTRIFTHHAGSYLLQCVRERVTRIDIATDIETDVLPSEFVSHREPGRFKSFSHVVSDTGETCYIGSMSSNRYARVYRYNEPHPRAGLLRAEHVFRQEDARKALDYGFANGLDKLVEQVALVYGWTHPAWDIAPAKERELTAHREERTDAGTVYWLYNTVNPSIARLVKDNKLDLKDFLADLYRKISDLDDNEPLAQITD